MQEKDLMIEWATTNGKAVRQRSVRQETTMFKDGTLPLNMSDYPKDKVSFSPNTVEEQPATQAAQAQDVNKLFNSDTVTQHTIYRDCMGNLPLCQLCLNKATSVQIKITYFKV